MSERDPAATPACQNCGALISARYCAWCGQDSHVRLTLQHFAEEAVEVLTHVDSSFWLSLRRLLTRPGQITADYLAGRRRLYAPPVRSYLVLSILYFLLSAWAATTPTGASSQVGTPGVQDCGELARGMEWLERLVPNLEESCLRVQRDRGEGMQRTFTGLLPKVMFLVLPLVALVQLALFRRRRPSYVENLIFVLHFQTFYYLAGAMLLLLGLLGTALFGPGPALKENLDALLLAWSAVYLYVANRRVYESGAMRAAFAVIALAVAYAVLWAASVATVGIYAFLHG